MKKFLLALALSVLGLTAVSGGASATTITINPNPVSLFTQTAAANENISNAYQFSFSGVADGAFGALALNISNLSTALCTDATCSTPALATGTPGSFGLLSLSTASFTSLVGGTYFLVISGLASSFGGGYLGGLVLNVTATPIPGALLLFMTALGGLGFTAFRRKSATAA